MKLESVLNLKARPGMYVTFPVFLIFLPQNPFLRFTYKRGENWWGDLLFTFVLLNIGVPDVETIYFVLIEQKK